ncbi:MAG: glycosyltransferase [Planctomycetota bacterium]|nr:glycosyltransferase [Planctomycetota bacterium]
MIVRDEEENLPRALASVKDLVDQIVIVDTGSTDKTVEIARSWGAFVVQIEWPDDFSAARNHALSLATEEWIMVIDADDEFGSNDTSLVRNLLETTEKEALSVRHTVSIEGGNQIVKDQVVFFRNRPEYRYRFRIHERLPIPPEGVERTPFSLRHHGYVGSSMPQKRARNERLLYIMKQDSDPESQVASAWYLGMQYREAGEISKAIEEFRQASYSNVASEYRLYSLLLLARTAAEIGEGEYAGELYRALLGSNPGAVEAALGMAALHARGGEWEKGEKYLEIAQENRIRILPWKEEGWELAIQALFTTSRA